MNPIVLDANYQQAVGTTQQHDLDVSKFLLGVEAITGAPSAVHSPRDLDGVASGTPGAASVGAIVAGVIPIRLTIPSDNKPGVHFLDVSFVTVNPSETPKVRIKIEVPF